MKAIYSVFDYDYTQQTYEQNEGISQTIPDQTMSIREIIDRYANGGIIERFTPTYGEEEDFTEMLPELYKMDLADRQSYAEQFKEEMEFMKSQTTAESVGTTHEGEPI
jgi:hypothetical protein